VEICVHPDFEPGINEPFTDSDPSFMDTYSALTYKCCINVVEEYAL